MEPDTVKNRHPMSSVKRKQSINVRDPSFREFRDKHASPCLCETRSIRCRAGIGGDAAFVRVGEVQQSVELMRVGD